MPRIVWVAGQGVNPPSEKKVEGLARLLDRG